MRLAVFSDVHANLHALRAVLDDIALQQPDAVYCLGDLVGYGAFPNEVIALVSERGIPTIMGNYDDGVGFERSDCGCAYKTAEMRNLGDLSLAWSKERVTAQNKAALRALLPSVRLEVGGRRVLLVHGSPRKINEYVYEDRSPASLEHIAQSSEADVLAFGHTHLPYSKEVHGVLLVNDGSVGKPKDGDPRAGYLLADFSPRPVITLRRVDYPVAAAAQAVRQSGLPEHFADLLETGGRPVPA
jgi:putative phosphoesterase